jgi:histidine triad (HIT) family protein
MEKNCAFCEIIGGKKQRELISETKNTLTILSNPSQIKGHCLVIPKRHVEKLSQLGRVERDELIKEVVKMQELLLTKASGCDIKQNYRPFIPDSHIKVSHLHFHVQPREFEDEMYKRVQIFEKDIFRDLPLDELKETRGWILNENGK